MVTVPIRVYSLPVMRSIYGTADRPRDDLTARAKILDAALDQFGAHGFDGATIRGIAGAAGVSPGLVQHHFGSKDGLRRACDEAVMGLIRRKLRATQDGRIASPAFLAALYADARPLSRYVARAVADGSSAGAALMDEIAEGAEEYLSANWPARFAPGSSRTRDAAAALVAQTAGTIVLHEHVARRMGLEPWADVLSPRIGLAQLDVYEALGEFVASGWGDEIREAVARLGEPAAGRAEVE